MRNTILRAALVCALLAAAIFLRASAPVQAAPHMPLATSQGGVKIELRHWKRGFTIRPQGELRTNLFFWFYEWNLFGAVNEGKYTSGIASNRFDVVRDEDGERVAFRSWIPGLRLIATPVADGVEMLLEVENKTRHDWPALATIIPCLSPGLVNNRSRNLDTNDTFYLGPEGLQLTRDNSWRDMHFNRELRTAIFNEGSYGYFPWSYRWPTSFRDALRGLMLRESKDDQWVVGVAWERFLSVQGHNPLHCLHVSVHVGPLKIGEKREIRGKIYMMRGDRNDLLKTFYSDFGRG